MLYNFTQDLSQIRENYESLESQIKAADEASRLSVAQGYSFNDNSNTESFTEEVDDDDYQNSGNNKKTSRRMQKTAKEYIKGSEDDDENNGKGEGLTTDTAIEGAGFLMDIGSSFSNTASSESESWNQTGKQTIQGAALGAKIAGPWGAAIGGAVGLGAGLVDMIGDSGRRNREERERIDKEMELRKTKREMQYSMDNQEKELEKLAALRKSQLNYLDLKY